MPASCPLCQGQQTTLYHQDKVRPYYQCSDCALVFVPPHYHLSAEKEKHIYDQHNNDPDDLGYRRFLNRLATPITERLPTNTHGLEFGCGPGPALAGMLEEAGYNISLYDLYYFPDQSVLQKTYDFITATEVIEHLANPAHTLEHLLTCLKTNGILGLMTKLVLSQSAFQNWHYIRDPTHICFYSKDTFAWIAKKYNLSLTLLGNDVILLKKN